MNGKKVEEAGTTLDDLRRLNPNYLKYQARQRAVKMFGTKTLDGVIPSASSKARTIPELAEELSRAVKDSSRVRQIFCEHEQNVKPDLKKLVLGYEHPERLVKAFEEAVRLYSSNKKWNIKKLATETFKTLKKARKLDKVPGWNTIRRLIRPLFSDRLPRGFRKKNKKTGQSIKVK